MAHHLAVPAFVMAGLTLLSGCSSACETIASARWEDPSVPGLLRSMGLAPPGLSAYPAAEDTAPFLSGLSQIEKSDSFGTFVIAFQNDTGGHIVLGPVGIPSPDEVRNETIRFLQSALSLSTSEASDVADEVVAHYEVVNDPVQNHSELRGLSAPMDGPFNVDLDAIRSEHPTWVIRWAWTTHIIPDFTMAEGSRTGVLQMYADGTVRLRISVPEMRFSTDDELQAAVTAAFDARGWPTPEFGGYQNTPGACRVAA